MNAVAHPISGDPDTPAALTAHTCVGSDAEAVSRASLTTKGGSATKRKPSTTAAAVVAFSVDPSTRMSGAVSPAMRPTPRMTPVMTPGIAAGRTTLLMVSHWLTPSAALASRSSSGTDLMASREVMSTSGRSMKPRTSIPAMSDSSPPSRGIRNAAPNRPKTMLGVDHSALVATSTRAVNGPCSAYSVRNTAAPTPSGTANSVAPTTSHTVPTMAGMMPPGSAPSGM